MCGSRRKKYKLWRPSSHEEFLWLGYVSDHVEVPCIWAILSVTNSVYRNVSVSWYKSEISQSDIVEMQVVKAEDNPRPLKRQTNTLFINTRNNEYYPFSFYFFLRIFSCSCMVLFWKHMQLLLVETATVQAEFKIVLTWLCCILFISICYQRSNFLFLFFTFLHPMESSVARNRSSSFQQANHWNIQALLLSGVKRLSGV